MRRGAPSRWKIVVAATESVGATIAPSVNAHRPGQAGHQQVRHDRDVTRS